MKICPLCKQEIAEIKTIEFLGTPIEKLGFSTRTRKALLRGGIESIEQLLLYTDKDLMRLRNFGKCCLAEVKENLRRATGMGNGFK